MIKRILSALSHHAVGPRGGRWRRRLLCAGVAGAGLSLLAPPPAGAIVGGYLARDGQFPWQVAIFTQGLVGKYSLHCGGSLLDADTVITAAHCVDGKRPAGVRVGYGSLKHKQTTRTAVSAIRTHPQYEATHYLFLTRYTHDVAIVKLAEPVPLGSGNPNIGTVNLGAAGSDPAKGTVITTSGWGTTRSGGSVPDDLYGVNVPIVDRPTCNTAYQSYGGVDDSMICAGEEQGGKDFCKRDEGGPLVTINGGTATLEGIASWHRGCAVKSYSGVYTRIGAVRPWIDAHRN